MQGNNFIRNMNKKCLLMLFYWSCAAMIWVYMAVTVINLYKSWYIAAVFAFIVSLILLYFKILNSQGLFNSLIYIVAYYLFLLITSIWAEYPHITIYYVAIESIFIVVFLLFYLLSMNFSLNNIIDFQYYLILPSISIYIITYIINPDASRLGGNANVFLPFTLLFCVSKIIRRFSFLRLFVIALCLIMLVISMSRTPLFVGIIGIVMMLFTIVDRPKVCYKMILSYIFILFIAIMSLLYIPTLRQYAIKTVGRFLSNDIIIGGELISSEPPDVLRWRIYDDAWNLYRSNWLLGIGYMNFQQWFGETYNYSVVNSRDKEVFGVNLHNTYQTWLLEGGILCILIVLVIMFRYFKILIHNIKYCTNPYDKSCYKLYVVVMICLIITGLFHQIHQTPVFYSVLGTVFALDKRHIT